jgi:hypothetical protein
MLREQYAGIQRQEDTLDRVEAGVSRVHKQAVAVRDEVRGQVRLVESLDYGVDTVHGRVDHVRGRVEDVLARMDRRLYYGLCFGVPFVLMLILVYLLKRVIL